MKFLPHQMLLACACLFVCLNGSRAQVYEVRTPVGRLGSGGVAVDATNDMARFASPYDLARFTNGTLYVTDANCVRKITPYGTNLAVTTLAGNSASIGIIDGTGPNARFNYPNGIVCETNGNLYLADTYNDSIRWVTSAGVVTTIAGTSGLSGTADGTGGAARFDDPYGIAIDNSGNLYVADTMNHTIRKLTPVAGQWQVTTVAGSAGNSGSTDGVGAGARFNNPVALTYRAGVLYVADFLSHTVRKITISGTTYTVSTLAGLAGVPGAVDGQGTAARLSQPFGIDVDGWGNVFISEAGNQLLRRITPAGKVSTIAGAAELAGGVDGVGGAARFSGPHGLALTPDGTLYVADIENFAIRSARVAPVVSLSPSGAKLVLNWSVLLTGYVAQASASLSTGYTNLPGAVTVDETTYITNTPSGTRAFYRLYKP